MIYVYCLNSVLILITVTVVNYYFIQPSNLIKAIIGSFIIAVLLQLFTYRFIPYIYRTLKGNN